MSGFTERQRAALSKALGYCSGMIPDDLRESVKELMERVDLNYVDCSEVCMSIFCLAYGPRDTSITQSPEYDTQKRDEATAVLHDLLTKYDKIRT